MGLHLRRLSRQMRGCQAPLKKMLNANLNLRHPVTSKFCEALKKWCEQKMVYVVYFFTLASFLVAKLLYNC